LRAWGVIRREGGRRGLSDVERERKGEIKIDQMAISYLLVYPSRLKRLLSW
jgi:hypothetical protein